MYKDLLHPSTPSILLLNNLKITVPLDSTSQPPSRRFPCNPLIIFFFFFFHLLCLIFPRKNASTPMQLTPGGGGGWNIRLKGGGILWCRSSLIVPARKSANCFHVFIYLSRY
jgi:hypothetical protein